MNGDALQVNIFPATPQGDEGNDASIADSSTQVAPSERRSFTLQAVRPRKTSVAIRLLERIPARVSGSVAASLSDYVYILHILIKVHEELPVRGVLSGIPMLLVLQKAVYPDEKDDEDTLCRQNVIKVVLAEVWLCIGKIWDCPNLVQLAEKVRTM